MRFLGIGLPWLEAANPEQAAAREKAKSDREELAVKIEQNRRAELERQQKDVYALAQGGIPTQARERLSELGDTEDAIFTSDLTPEEAGLLRREGFRAIGIVTGSAMYHVGQAYASAYSDCEVKVLSDAYDAAMALAVGRMAQELRAVKAHGVVGVRLSLVRHEWADKTIEVQVIGTAVAGPGTPPPQPWMCDLSGQEWYALRRAGYQPVGLVWGHATWFILTDQYDENTMRYSYQNIEMGHWSEALSMSRHIAMDTVRTQAKQHGATGVVGVRIARRLDEVHLTGGTGPVYEREHHNLVLSVIGTAVRSIPHAPTSVRPTVQMLSLRDGRLAPVQIGAADLAVE